MGRREEDLRTWTAWQGNPNKRNMGVVLKQLNPLIQKEVNRWSGNYSLARPLLELEANRLASEAVNTYSPQRGAALATHVTNRLKKLSRLPYTHQNLARLPEHQTLKFHSFHSAKAELEDKLGREPTSSELTDELGWTRSYMSRFQKGMRKEFLESGDPVAIFDSTSDDSQTIDFIYNDMSPMQQKLFEHTTGYGGMPTLTNPQLMRKLKLSQGQLSYQKRLLVNKISDLTGGGVS